MKILIQENNNGMVLIMIDQDVRSEYYFSFDLWCKFRETVGAPTEREMAEMGKEKANTYSVFWSENDEGYVGLCAQFPSLSWVGAFKKEALAGIKRVVAESLADIAKDSKPIKLVHKKEGLPDL